MTRYSLASSTWDDKEISAIEEVMRTGHFTMGEKVRTFEEEFASFFGKKFAVMSNSGSSANLLAMAAIHYSSRSPLARGKNEVIVPTVSWSTTYYPVTQLGYVLKFVDVDSETLNMNVAAVREAVNERTAGIFAVNLLGNPASLLELQVLAKEFDLFLLEDNCESMGAKIGDRFAGSIGEIGTFSCFFSHHISTMEGGMCVTDDEELAQIMISMRAHGWTRELPAMNHVFNKTGDKFDDLFRFVLPGYNLRPLEMSGAIGIEQLRKLPSFIEARQRNAKVFIEEFGRMPGIKIQRESGESSWFGFSIIFEGALAGKRNDIARFFSENEIDCRPIVAGNFTRNPVMKHLPHVEVGATPVADEIHENGLFLGNHHFDLATEIRRAARVLQTYISMMPNEE